MKLKTVSQTKAHNKGDYLLVSLNGLEVPVEIISRDNSLGAIAYSVYFYLKGSASCGRVCVLSQQVLDLATVRPLNRNEIDLSLLAD